MANEISKLNIAGTDYPIYGEGVCIADQNTNSWYPVNFSSTFESTTKYSQMFRNSLLKYNPTGSVLSIGDANGGTISMYGISLPSSKEGNTRGHGGSGQVIISNGSGKAYWGDIVHPIVGGFDTIGAVKNGSNLSTVTSSYVPCPIVDGVPYYLPTSVNLDNIDGLDNLMGAGEGININKGADVANIISLLPPQVGTPIENGQLGGIKVANKWNSYAVNPSVAPASSISTPTKLYAVELDKNNVAFVHVPWTNSGGTLQSVSLSMPSSFTVTGSPVTGSAGNISVSLASGYKIPTEEEFNTIASNTSIAKSTADTAKSTADTAKSTADTAKSTADTAKSTAEGAVTTANNAKTTAEGAKSAVDDMANSITTKNLTATSGSLTVDTLAVNGTDIMGTLDIYNTTLGSHDNTLSSHDSRIHVLEGLVTGGELGGNGLSDLLPKSDFYSAGLGNGQNTGTSTKPVYVKNGKLTLCDEFYKKGSLDTQISNATTAASNATTAATTAANAADRATTAANNATTAANEAKNTATDAQSTANSALTAVNNIDLTEYVSKENLATSVETNQLKATTAQFNTANVTASTLTLDKIEAKNNGSTVFKVDGTTTTCQDLVITSDGDPVNVYNVVHPIKNQIKCDDAAGEFVINDNQDNVAFRVNNHGVFAPKATIDGVDISEALNIHTNDIENLYTRVSTIQDELTNAEGGSIIDTNWYPTGVTFTQVDGGAKMQIYGEGMNAIEASLPIGTTTTAGIITTSSQALKGLKIFGDGIQTKSIKNLGNIEINTTVANGNILISGSNTALTSTTTFRIGNNDSYDLVYDFDGSGHGRLGPKHDLGGVLGYPDRRFYKIYGQYLYADQLQSESNLILAGKETIQQTIDGDTVIQVDVSGMQLEGSICATQGFFETSDERLKNFIKPIDVDLEKLSNIKKHYFTWKDGKDTSMQLGVSAQEIQSIYPEIVNEKEDGTLTVAYDKLSIIALKAVDELYKKNQELEKRLERLEKLLA